MSASLYLPFDRDEWAALRANTPMTLTEDDVAKLRGLGDRIDLDEVAEIYLPLSRLLNLYVQASQQLQFASSTFLGSQAPKVPFVIGLAGSVAVGKSTTSRILQALLARWPDHPRVDLVTTDGFLHPNAVLERRGIMNRKGFPESYDRGRLLDFMRAVKSGEPQVSAPLYSHVVYDIVDDQEQVVSSPDILIIEGLNVLQVGEGSHEFVSDYFDFSIYVHADENHVREWYVHRFLKLCDTIFQDETSYFHRFAHLTRDEAVATARGIWDEINGRNLKDNILPTRERAGLILHKGLDHLVTGVLLRKT